ncbi:phage virion morphogenesis protein [Schlesneria sp. T3-172]|uniref:phage virion morphogenesis protein n=1 Tax=Schlesneria sphaerica TaxID=3373610 RepID=UPI0037C7C35A
MATADTSAFESLYHDMETVVQRCDYGPMLEQFQQVIAQGEEVAFRAQSTPGGVPWAPLAESTVRRKGHAYILVDTGDLASSLIDVDGPGNINATNSHGLMFGTDVEYAIFHETGTSRMPARPAVGMSDETLDDLCERVARATIDSL